MGKDKEAVSSEQKKPASPQGQPAPAEGKPSHHGGSDKKGNTGAKVGCHAQGCKGKDVRFNFCDEHFRQFKFGLITKSGDPVLDYERKFEHYQKWKQSQKVA